ncbi:MAG TPA: VWA domain-containing protein, partial [Spirochaetota bacterium]|nr:VWA domain-containing protein [Spirochaetota bacterium]
MLKRSVFFILVFSILFSVEIYSQTNDDALIQMAILLDTSNSMDGLIDQAKSQLWKIVNELALSKKNGKSPKLEVALYEYGNDSLPKSDGHIRLVSPLTTDLDLISEKLFGLKTNGGDEYCGQVIKESIEKLNWSKNNKILKLIFIAGNEPFNQGNVDYKKSCKDAISKGIIVNTIFCGDAKTGIDTFWKEGADLSDGKYVNIDQNVQEVYVEAPQDKEIAKLNEELNKTYVYYGKGGSDKKVLQEKQDTNAKGLNMEAFIQRSVTKSKEQYNNSSWDMVDAVKNENLNLDKVKEEELPPEMKKMSKEEKAIYIEKQSQKRKEIQEKINKLNNERTEYINKV